MPRTGCLPQKALRPSAAGLCPDCGLNEFGLPDLLTAPDTDHLVSLGLDVSVGEQLSVDTWAGTDFSALAGEAWLVSSGSGSAEEGSGSPVAVVCAKDKADQARAQNRAKQARFRQRQKVGRHRN